MNRCAAKPLISLVALLLASAVSWSADARRLVDLNPGPTGSYPSNLTAFANQLFFSAYTVSTGIELWRWDGTEIHLVADINNTADDIGGGIKEGNDSVPHWLTKFAGDLYFTAYDPAKGGELWRTDGTNVFRLTDIAPDSQPGGTNYIPKSSWPNELTVYNGQLYFSATSSTNPLNYELWRYDTNSGASLVADLHPNSGTNHSSYPNKLFVFDGSLYFMANDGAHGWELWKHNPSETTLLDINPGALTSSSYPKSFTTFSNYLYFQAYTDAEGFELWRTDGSNPTLVADLFPGPESSYPEFFTFFNGGLFFRGTDPSVGSELLRFDGSQITIAADVNPAGSSYPKNLLTYRGSLYFSADDGLNGWELWRYDGASASIVTNLHPDGDSFPENFTVSDGILFFTATTPDTGYELFQFDGTNVTLAADLNGSPADSYPRFLTSADRKLFFSAADTRDTNWELWMFDPGFTNQVPMISLVSPTNGAIFDAGESFNITATASDEYEVVSVEFFIDDNLVWLDDSPPFSVTNSLSPGTFSIMAKATDSSGAITLTPTVTITIREAPFEPPQIIAMSFSENSFNISFSADPATSRTHVLEASSDLLSWTQVDSQVPLSNPASFSYQTSSDYLFFRVVVLP
jgi:ELWxxDGT repeat protein